MMEFVVGYLFGTTACKRKNDEREPSIRWNQKSTPRSWIVLAFVVLGMPVYAYFASLGIDTLIQAAFTKHDRIDLPRITAPGAPIDEADGYPP